jgi:MoxR-like ATPase
MTDASPFTRLSPADVDSIRAIAERLQASVERVIVGKTEVVRLAMVALLCEGHILLEDVPGIGKTTLAKSIARSLGCSFRRIQFTPDLMPSDITGIHYYNQKLGEFTFREGPLIAQVVLADEINRATPRTQAALLEAMEERQLTVEGETTYLPRPFLVLATQNPIEAEGTYNLPEAQLDRFMFKLVVSYPSFDQEAEILTMHSTQVELDQRLEALQTLTGPAEIVEMARRAGEVLVDPKLVHYINTLVRATREWPQFYMGASPRAGLALVQGARTLAAFRGRDYAVPDDVVELSLPALRHRVILSAEAEVEGRRVDDLLTEVIRSVEVPRL